MTLCSVPVCRRPLWRSVFLSKSVRFRETFETLETPVDVVRPFTSQETEDLHRSAFELKHVLTAGAFAGGRRANSHGK